MTRYKKYTKNDFENQLRGVLYTNRCGFLKEITQEWIAEGNYSAEYIYEVSTKNKAVKIIIFSSVTMEGKKVRDIGADAVRVVMRWNTRKGSVYKKLAKHYRLNTLFNNLTKTLVEAQANVFNLKYDEFTAQVDTAA